MNPSKVRRDRLEDLTDLPNIGPAMARDLRLLGINHPTDLTGQNPTTLYDRLCELTETRQDPCVLDVFISVTRFMNGEEPKPWWHYTPERKAGAAEQGCFQILGQKVAKDLEAHSCGGGPCRAIARIEKM